MWLFLYRSFIAASNSLRQGHHLLWPTLSKDTSSSGGTKVSISTAATSRELRILFMLNWWFLQLRRLRQMECPFVHGVISQRGWHYPLRENVTQAWTVRSTAYHSLTLFTPTMKHRLPRLMFSWMSACSRIGHTNFGYFDKLLSNWRLINCPPIHAW